MRLLYCFFHPGRIFDWFCWIHHVFLLVFGWLPLDWLYNLWGLGSLPWTLQNMPNMGLLAPKSSLSGALSTSVFCN
ncbi:uncharacterized protein M421DRAFT_247538 [Didymella exigua CBS 183.55]|uniref:Uncharacterized protein n=1 Tax=Didymella exigua CBS 183.55 TaxID=1150837 RepID=A0A6A5RWC7_9PLEO|nr:uncharacterized protein M421DRAFT_247538 [Didymella exigua CBS 183.55]KAF1932721.1 hypothetical protein M421DRAFT_247538 [Didymella exigua CBS 183.55]